MSPNQANNFEKLTCINIQETRQWIDNKKKIGNKWKRRQNQYWRVDFSLYQVNSGVGDNGVSERVSGSVYSDSHMVLLKFHDSLLFNLIGFNFLIY